MVPYLSEIHTLNKVDNTSIISLDVSNQEDDEKKEDILQGGEISYPEDEKSLPRGIKF